MAQWRDCLYYPNYVVSDEGQVARKKDGLVLKQYPQKSGYVYVWVNRGQGRHSVPVHILVCIAFHGDYCYTKGMYVDHINTVRSDNRALNLRWVTPKQNSNNEITRRRKKIEQEIHSQAMKLHTTPTYEELCNFALHFIELGRQFSKQ